MGSFGRVAWLLLSLSSFGFVQGQQAQSPAAPPPAGAPASANDDNKKEDRSAGSTQPSPALAAPAKAADPDDAALPTEDFTNLAVPPDLQMASDQLGEQEYPGYTRELVRLMWRGADPIDLWVLRPTGVKKPPVVLYLYSYPSSNIRYQNLELCKFLTQDGVAAVGFLSALTGDRFHDRPQKQWFISELQESMGSSVHDVQIILQYLDKRGDMDMTRVGMFGDGSGASIAIMAAAVDQRIKVLDLLNPWGDWPDWMAKSTLVPEKERPDYLKPDFLKKVENLDPVKWFPQLKTPQIRLQVIKSGHTVTPMVVKERMEAAAPQQTKIVHYEDTKTFMSDVVAKGKNFEWIQGQLRALDMPSHASDRSQAKSKAPVGGSSR
jgi:hypothetical protein